MKMLPLALVVHVITLSSENSPAMLLLSTSLDISKKLNLLHWKNVIISYLQDYLQSKCLMFEKRQSINIKILFVC